MDLSTGMMMVGATINGTEGEDQATDRVSGDFEAVQDLADFLSENIRRKGFLQKRRLALDPLREYRMVRIAGHIQHFDFRTDGRQLFCDFRTAPLRHDDVRQQ